MSIYLIIEQPGNVQRLGTSVPAAFPHAYYALANGTWMVAHSGTAKEVSDLVGVTEGRDGAGLVIEVGSYYGHANPAVWTWIRQNWKAGSDG